MKPLSKILGKKIAVFAFGRMNPPTIGHEKLINKLLSVSKDINATPFLFVSHTQDPKKNPLNSKDKVKYIRLGIPKISNHIVYDTSVKTPFDALRYIEKEGYTDVIMIAGADRVSEFKKNIGVYINHSDPKKSLNFNSFDVISAGERDPDSEGVSGISASKMREFAIKNDFASFQKGAPSNLSLKYSKDMFNDIIKGMKLVELFEEIKKLSNSLNVPRNKMPQIKNKHISDFIKMLKNNDVEIHQVEMSVKNLKPTQNEINLNKVRKKYDDFSQEYAEVKPFIVSFDGYVLDGHHQLFALKALDSNFKVPCYVVHLKMKDLLSYANKFPNTTYKTILD